jgi:hypothetical protein
MVFLCETLRLRDFASDGVLFLSDQTVSPFPRPAQERGVVLPMIMVVAAVVIVVMVVIMAVVV